MSILTNDTDLSHDSYSSLVILPGCDLQLLKLLRVEVDGTSTCLICLLEEFTSVALPLVFYTASRANLID